MNKRIAAICFTAAFPIFTASGSAVERLVPSQYATIQAAIDAAEHGDTIIVAPGTYYENIHFNGKNIALTSTDPNDPQVVAGTVIDASGLGTVVTFSGSEEPNCILTGFTITGGSNTEF